MRKKILELLDGKINEIFFEMQNELNIDDGGIFRLDALYLDELQEKLAEHIEHVLKYQMEN